MQENECSKRITLCKFCATHVEMGNLGEHENYCGSRTEKCEKVTMINDNSSICNDHIYI